MLKLFLVLFPLVTFADVHLVSGCRIVKITGEVVMSFPGRSCTFLPDGNFLSAGGEYLRRFSSTGEIQWEKKLPGNQMSYSYSPVTKHILLVTSRKGDLPGDPVNYELIHLSCSITERMRSSQTSARQRTADTF